MYLIERLVGISCYILVLLFVFCVIYYQKLRVKGVLIFYALALTVMAYFFVPPETADLFQIQTFVKYFAGLSFDKFYEMHLVGNSISVAYFLYWVVGKIGNVSLLPVLATLITYSVTFYILYKSSELYKAKNREIALILLFIMSTGNYMMVISNIRTMMAISLLCLCFFRESVLKRFSIWHILLYVLAALIHNLAIVLLIIRGIVFFVAARIKIKWKLLFVLGCLTIGGYMFFQYEWLFDSVWEKSLEFIMGEYYSYAWEYIIAFVAVFVEIQAIRLHMKFGDELLTELMVFLTSCVVVAVIFIGEFSIFHRISTYIAPILAVPLLMVGFSKLRAKVGLEKVFFLISLASLFLACSRGSLSSLKFFVL